MAKGWYWPFLLAAILAAGVAANIYFMYRALVDPSFAVEPDYYAKAVSWDAHQAQARENADLGWTLTMTVGPADPRTGLARLVAHVADRDGNAIDGLAVRLEAFHNARAAHIVNATLTETRNHEYAADAAIVRAGLWEFRVVAGRAGSTFTAVVDHAVPGLAR